MKILKYFFFVFFHSCQAEFNPNEVPHTTKAQLNEAINDGSIDALVYFYTKFEDCPSCRSKMEIFHEASDYLNTLEEGKVKCFKLAVKFPDYGVIDFPQILFFLGGTPFRYDNSELLADEIVEWVVEAKQTPLPELTDETFEHLTQASTGATTGDWLIMFADSERPECMKPYKGDLATTAVRLRRRKNVAIIDTRSNPISARRFGIDPKNHCIKILFFHRTDLYYFNNDDKSSTSLVKFVLKDFAESEAFPIPPPVDQSSEKLEDMISLLKESFLEHTHSHHWTFICGIGVGLSAVFAAIIFVLRKFRKRKIN